MSSTITNIVALDAYERPLQYPKYEYRLLTNIIYARKYNVFFALGKDFGLKVITKVLFSKSNKYSIVSL